MEKSRPPERSKKGVLRGVSPFVLEQHLLLQKKYENVTRKKLLTHLFLRPGKKSRLSKKIHTLNTVLL